VRKKKLEMLRKEEKSRRENFLKVKRSMTRRNPKRSLNQKKR